MLRRGQTPRSRNRSAPLCVGTLDTLLSHAAADSTQTRKIIDINGFPVYNINHWLYFIDTMLNKVKQGADMARVSQAESSGKVITGQIAKPLGAAQAVQAVIQVDVMALVLGARPGREFVASGDYRTGKDLPVSVQYDVRNRTGRLRVIQSDNGQGRWHKGWHFGLRGRRSPRTTDYRLDLDLTDAVPLDLDVLVGVGKADLDLSGLTVRSLRLEGGVGRSVITLPRQGSVDLDVTSGVGEVVVEPAAAPGDLQIRRMRIGSGVGSVRMELPDCGGFEVLVDSGMGDVVLQVPPELAASVECSSGIGRVRVEQGRFERVGHGRWQTRGFAEGGNRVRIRVDSGMGNVSIES